MAENGSEKIDLRRLRQNRWVRELVREYRVSVDSTAWIDVLDGDMVVERTKLNRRMQCGHVHKSLGFTLKTGVNYWLQLSSSKAPEVHLVLTPEESS